MIKIIFKLDKLIVNHIIHLPQVVVLFLLALRFTVILSDCLHGHHTHPELCEKLITFILSTCYYTFITGRDLVAL